uniref:REST corepressor 3 n=2 Tax=Cacopsylla melanoneura TaxID=428564 RepID=A0A8D8YIL0_9HEMI
MSIMDSNTKKTRLPSPLDDDLNNDKEHYGRIRVGKDYQVPVPAFSPPTESAQDSPDMALQVWCPTDKLSDVKLSNYLLAAKEKFGYKEEQSLGMLLWHQHSLKDAITDLANFMPCPDEWTMKDKILFEQAFQFHGKNFYGIRTMLPEKKIAQLVKYYYMWKKTRNSKSLVDKYQTRKKMKAMKNGEDSLDIDEDMSDNELPSEKKWKPGCQQKAPVPSTRHNESQGEGFCSNCHIHCSNCYSTPKGKMCASCQMHFKRTGTLRPTMANDVNTLSVLKLRKNPPKGMYLNHDDLSLLSIDAQANAVLSNLSREVVSCKHTIQLNKQLISGLLGQQSKLGSIGKYQADPVTKSPTISTNWNSAEMSFAVHGIHKYGKNFKAIAEVMETKTETHIKHFYNKYKNYYNLDTLLTENDPGNCIMDTGDGKS